MPEVNGIPYGYSLEEAKAAAERYLRDGPKPTIVYGTEVDHICCCFENVALCGANVAGQGVAFGNPEHSMTLCRICANKDADGERCGAKDCPGPERVE